AGGTRSVGAGRGRAGRAAPTVRGERGAAMISLLRSERELLSLGRLPLAGVLLGCALSGCNVDLERMLDQKKAEPFEASAVFAARGSGPRGPRPRPLGVGQGAKGRSLRRAHPDRDRRGTARAG